MFKVGVQLDGSVVVFQGLAVQAQLTIGQSPVVEGPRGMGIQLDRLVIVLNGTHLESTRVKKIQGHGSGTAT